VQDKEPKYGLVAIGFVDPRRMLTKGGARPGDRLVVTKPLGFGVTTTALKQQKASTEDVAEVVGWMTRLNRVAGQLAVESALACGTDVTGFSVLGHGWEMAHASQVGFRVVFDQVPFVSCAVRYAEQWTFPGGASDNRSYFGKYVRFSAQISEMQQMLLFDPQTSGGLLLAVPNEKMNAFRQRAAQLEQPIWEIGEVMEGEGIDVV